jgi:hypothetical protein
MMGTRRQLRGIVAENQNYVKGVAYVEEDCI